MRLGQRLGWSFHRQPHRPARLRGAGRGAHGDDLRPAGLRGSQGKAPMSWLPLSPSAFPAILWGLLALPVIWWLLRLTPPKPHTEVFPPLRILARVLKKEETPHRAARGG